MTEWTDVVTGTSLGTGTASVRLEQKKKSILQRIRDFFKVKGFI